MNRHSNLKDASGDLFYSRLRETFYIMLLHYAFDPLVQPQERSTAFYMTSITDRLIQNFNMTPESVEAATGRKMMEF